MVMPVEIDFAGQAALHAGHAVLHVDGGDVEVVAGLEGDRDLRWCRCWCSRS